jgi:hypothetical protein
MLPGSLSSVSVVSRFTVELSPVFAAMLAARRETTAVAFAEIVMMINVTIKVFGTVEPGAGTDEYTAREPLRTVVTVGSTVIRWYFVIPIRTNRRRSNSDGNLRSCIRGSSNE